MRKKAFTLSEILIALMVIGVIAAITVPALIQRTNKQEYVSALKKAYSALSQATQAIIAEEGSPKCDDGGWACTPETVYGMYKKYLVNIKDCAGNKGCAVTRYSFYSKSSPSGDLNYRSDIPKFIMSDGTVIMIDSASFSKTCNNFCTRIIADINGFKNPNIWGRDVFEFALQENGLYPMGCNNEASTCSQSDGGRGCACKVLRDGAMNY